MREIRDITKCFKEELAYIKKHYDGNWHYTYITGSIYEWIATVEKRLQENNKHIGVMAFLKKSLIELENYYAMEWITKTVWTNNIVTRFEMDSFESALLYLKKRMEEEKEQKE